MRISLQKKAFLNLILAVNLVLQFPAYGNSSPIESQIPKANICEAVLSHSVSLFVLASTEYMVVTSSALQALWSRCQAKRVSAMVCKESESDFANFEEFVSYRNQLHLQKDKWAVKSMGFPRYGSILTGRALVDGSLNVLQEHIEAEIPDPYAIIALQTMQSFLDYDKVTAWIKSIREEVLKDMWNDGLRKIKYLKNHNIREYYLDRVLARRVQKQGFKIKSNGFPYSLITSNPYSFHYALAKGHFFIDWTGANLKSASGADFKNHSARGHSLALAYAAEQVDDFILLSRYIGRTFDSRGLWGQMFDNALSTTTPFWGGYWVYSFQEYLGIEN